MSPYFFCASVSTPCPSGPHLHLESVQMLQTRSMQEGPLGHAHSPTFLVALWFLHQRHRRMPGVGRHPFLESLARQLAWLLLHGSHLLLVVGHSPGSLSKLPKRTWCFLQLRTAPICSLKGKEMGVCSLEACLLWVGAFLKTCFGLRSDTLMGHTSQLFAACHVIVHATVWPLQFTTM